MRARALSMAENDQGIEYAVQKSDAEWREGLSDMEYQVLRLKGTERPGTGEYNKFAPKDGHFVCAGCGQASCRLSVMAMRDPDVFAKVRFLGERFLGERELL